MKKYFVPYNEKEKANYIYLLMFYSIAKYNTQSKRYDTITYANIKDLRDQLNNVSDKSISYSTVKRIIEKRQEYRAFFSIDSKSKKIQILNDIHNCKKFVVISEKEAQILMNKGDNLLATYYLYLKYYYGYVNSKKKDPTESKKIDTTAKQFLAACGYSDQSHSYISKVSEYNSLLVREGLITITKYKDNNGYERNCYAVVA